MAAKKDTYDVVKLIDLDLAGEIDALDIAGASQCVRVLHQNARQGTVACKGRSDVAFSNKKPWKQKGTGRARAGTKRSPLWRKGGVIFGPQERSRTLKVPKKLRAGVLRSMIHSFLVEERVYALEWAPTDGAPKTSQAYSFLKDAGLAHKKINLFVAQDDLFTQASFTNIPDVQVISFDSCNVYDLARAEYVVYLKRDAELFKEMVHKWI